MEILLPQNFANLFLLSSISIVAVEKSDVILIPIPFYKTSPFFLCPKNVLGSLFPLPPNLDCSEISVMCRVFN